MCQGRCENGRLTHHHQELGKRPGTRSGLWAEREVERGADCWCLCLLWSICSKWRNTETRTQKHIGSIINSVLKRCNNVRTYTQFPPVKIKIMLWSVFEPVDLRFQVLKCGYVIVLNCMFLPQHFTFEFWSSGTWRYIRMHRLNHHCVVSSMLLSGKPALLVACSSSTSLPFGRVSISRSSVNLHWAHCSQIRRSSTKQT